MIRPLVFLFLLSILLSSLNNNNGGGGVYGGRSIQFEVFNDSVSGHSYMFGGEDFKVNYTEAVQIAREYGGYLPTITSQYEFEYITKFVLDNEGTRVWLSAEQDINTKEWVWMGGPEYEARVKMTSSPYPQQAPLSSDVLNCPYACPWQYAEPNHGEERYTAIGYWIADYDPTRQFNLLIEIGNTSLLYTAVPTEGANVEISLLGNIGFTTKVRTTDTPFDWQVKIGGTLINGGANITNTTADCVMLAQNGALPKPYIICIMPPARVGRPTFETISIWFKGQLVAGPMAIFSYAPPKVNVVSAVELNARVTIFGSSFGNDSSAITLSFGDTRRPSQCTSVSVLVPHNAITCTIPAAQQYPLVGRSPVKIAVNNIQSLSSTVTFFNPKNKHFYRVSNTLLSFPQMLNSTMNTLASRMDNNLNLYANGYTSSLFSAFPELIEYSYQNESSAPWTTTSSIFYPPEYMYINISTTPPTPIRSPRGYLASITSRQEEDWVRLHIPSDMSLVVGMATSSSSIPQDGSSLFCGEGQLCWRDGPDRGVLINDTYMFPFNSSTSAGAPTRNMETNNDQWYLSNARFGSRFLIEYGPNRLYFYTDTGTNLPTSGGQLIIRGDTTPYSNSRLPANSNDNLKTKVMIGSSFCESYLPFRDDDGPGVQCIVPAGVGSDLPITFIYGAQAIISMYPAHPNSLYNWVFSYYPPTMHSIKVMEISHVNGIIIEISGDSFGPSTLYIGEILIGSFLCLNVTMPFAHTSLSCHLPFNMRTVSSVLDGGSHSIFITVGNRRVFSQLLFPLYEHQCGDDLCWSAASDGGTESCMSCPVDCGLCHLCGDGICLLSVDGGEDCLSCPADCGACPPSPPYCGDSICDASIEETCESCRLDCGLCPATCPGSPLFCSGRGECLGDGVCLCGAGWSGPSCNDTLTPVTPIVNGSTIIIIVPSTPPSPNNTNSNSSSSSSLLAFSILVVELQELARNDTVLARYPVSPSMFQISNGSGASTNVSLFDQYVTIQNGQASAEFEKWEYEASLEGISIILQIIYFKQSCIVSFAGQNTTAAAESIKLTMIVKNFPFLDISSHRLGIVLNQTVTESSATQQQQQGSSTTSSSSSSSQPCNNFDNYNNTSSLGDIITNTQDSLNNGSLVWAKIQSQSGVQLYSTFNLRAYVDDRRVTISNDVYLVNSSSQASSSSSSSSSSSNNTTTTISSSFLVRLVVPAFASLTVIDPTFGVLLNLGSNSALRPRGNGGGECNILSTPAENNRKEGQVDLVVAIVTPVVLFVVLVVASVVLYRVYKGKHAAIPKEIQLEENDT
eukprot:TRINITY_DN3384_c0_g1_i1.p1 TRINITY_DN3384_c0_g1~~TRINITY_DN3384_c0_g1_i1.p1  ORF type:complete len:1314 (+),score=210.72 TRINITY_DN3384_c0_g1_i1:33-3944(+)